MAEWETESDHAGNAVDRLLFQHRSKDRIVSLAGALGDGVQTLEDEIDALITLRRLDVATGAALEQWAGVVGEQRGALATDADLRRFVQARILINKCHGDSDSLLEIWSLVTDATAIGLSPAYPCTFILRGVVATMPDAAIRRRIARAMADAKPMGIGMTLILAETGFFGFAENPDALGFDAGKLARSL
jgi:hypothetical protein